MAPSRKDGHKRALPRPKPRPLFSWNSWGKLTNNPHIRQRGGVLYITLKVCDNYSSQLQDAVEKIIKARSVYPHLPKIKAASIDYCPDLDDLDWALQLINRIEGLTLVTLTTHDKHYSKKHDCRGELVAHNDMIYDLVAMEMEIEKGLHDKFKSNFKLTIYGPGGVEFK